MHNDDRSRCREGARHSSGSDNTMSKPLVSEPAVTTEAVTVSPSKGDADSAIDAPTTMNDDTTTLP